MTLPVLNLMPGDMPFRVDPKNSYTLPARFYHDPQIWEAEKDAIFYKTWFCAGHVSQVAEPGQFLTVRIHDQNVFVARTRTGDLNAFYNVCPHRGHELVSGTGKKNIITCPYHAWAFDFDGTLKSARNTENVEGFRKEEFSLKPVKVEVFCGLVLVNLDSDAEPFAEQMGELEKEIRHFVPSVDDLQYAQRDTYEVEANWKVLVDNFLECYHCAPAHKDFVDLVDMDSYRTITCGLYSSQCAGNPKTLNSRAYSFQPGDVDFGYGLVRVAQLHHLGLSGRGESVGLADEPDWPRKMHRVPGLVRQGWQGDRSTARCDQLPDRRAAARGYRPVRKRAKGSEILWLQPGPLRGGRGPDRVERARRAPFPETGGRGPWRPT